MKTPSYVVDKQHDVGFIKILVYCRENARKIEDMNNNKKYGTMHGKRSSNPVEGSTVLVDEHGTNLIAYQPKLSVFRRSNTIATPHRRYGMQQRPATGDRSAESNRRSKIQSEDFLRRKSRAKPSPDEIKRLYEQQYTRKTSVGTKIPPPKKAWQEKDEKQKNTKPTKHYDLDERLGAYGSVSQAKQHRQNQKLEVESAKVGDENTPFQSHEAEKEPPEVVAPPFEDAKQNQDEEPAPLVPMRRSRSSFERRGRPCSMIITSTKEDGDLRVDDLENYVDTFAKRERERMFERTQLRRSYIRLPKSEDNWKRPLFDPITADHSINEMEKEEKVPDLPHEVGVEENSRSSSVSSYSASIVSSSQTDDIPDVYSSDASRVLDEEYAGSPDGRRHSDIRERIRRYKESTSSVDELPTNEKRKSSAGSHYKDSLTKQATGKFEIKRSF